MRASVRYRAALRMLLYTQRRAGLQLGCLLLALALLTIPLNGVATPEASSLSPLRTTFIPFEAAIQSPSPTVVQFSLATLAAKKIVLAWNAGALAMSVIGAFVPAPTLDTHAPSGTVVFTNGRSPPRA